MRQHQRDGLRMFGVEQLAQLLRIGALQLGQISLRCLLRAAHQHQQVVGALLAEGLDQHAAGVVQAAVHHEVLRVEKLPELLQHLGRELRRDAAQIGQLLGDLLHVGLRQRAQNLLGQILAHGNQQDRRLAHPGEVRRLADAALPRFRFPAQPRRVPFLRSRFHSLSLPPSDLVGVNPALQQPRALRRLALQMRRHLLEDLLRPQPLRIDFGRRRRR